MTPTGGSRFEFLKDGVVVITDYAPNGSPAASMTGEWRKADNERYIITISMLGMQTSTTAKKMGRFLRVQMGNEMYCLEKVSSGETKPKPRPKGSTEESRCS